MSERPFRVLVIGPSQPDPRNQLHTALIEAGCDLVFGAPKTAREIAALGKAADVVVAGASLTAEAIDELDQCKLIVRTGIGYDTIDVAAATRRGILVVNVPDSWTEEVANHTMALLLACHRRLLTLHLATKAGQWGRGGGPRVPTDIHRLSHQTLGLLGFGNIARIVARRAAAFDLQIIASDPFLPEATMKEHGVASVDLEQLWRRSDYLSIHTPLNDSTHHLIGAEQLGQMKKTAFLINTARGGVIDEAALATAVRDGSIAGAALDVVEHEPIQPDHPFLALDSVLLTPHAAYYSREAVEWCQAQAAREILAVRNGQSPRRVAVVNKELLGGA